MIGKIAKYFPLIVAGVLLLHLFFVWVHTTVDSWYMYALAEYFRTGKYTFLWPTIYTNPKVLTDTPPLYSVFLALIYPLPNADFFLHILQLAMYIGTVYLLYLVLRQFLQKPYAIIISCLFALIPGNLVFISYIMTDIGAQFLFMIYIFLIYKYLTTKNIQLLALSVLIGFITGLWKYSFVLYGGISLAILLFKHPRTLSAYIFPAIGVISILSWILIQHSWTGLWAMNDSTGISLHLGIVAQNKLLPSDKSPIMKEFKSYVPSGTNLYVPFWDFVDFLPSDIKNDYIKINKLFGSLALAAIREHPLEVTRSALDAFIEVHNAGAPYWSNLSTYGESNPTAFKLYCKKYGNIQMCKPIIMTRYSYPIWNTFIRASDWFYAYIFPIWSMWLFFPLLLWSVIFGNTVLKTLSWLLIIGKIPISIMAWIDARYLLPFYPLMFIISCLAVKDIQLRLSTILSKKR